jgi:hypothetical protein
MVYKLIEFMKEGEFDEARFGTSWESVVEAPPKGTVITIK